MKLFIDTAKLDEIKEAYSWGIVDGITTNPSLMKKAVDAQKKKIGLETYIKQILTISKGTPVSLEVTTSDYENMVKEGKTLYKKFHKFGNVYIKIPVNPAFCNNDECKRNDFDGIKAIKTLTKSKIPINCTLIFSPEQALLAAKAGAKFLSPFAGREDDFIREKAHIKFKKTDYFSGIKNKSDNGILSGIDLVKKCVEVIKASKLKSEILAASIRNTRQLRQMAIVGADIATMPFNVLKQTIVHVKTVEGMKAFKKDIVPEYAKIAGGRK